MPFAGGLAAPPNAALLFSIAAAFLYFVIIEQPPSWRRMAVRTLPVALLAFLAFDQDGPWLLIAALLASALGDAFLARDGGTEILAGLASFLAARLAYAILFAAAGDGALVFAEPWRALVAAAVLAFCAGLMFRLWRVLEAGLRPSAAAYAAAALGMSLAALTLPVPLVILGAVLLIVSDGLLAAGRFLLARQSPHRGRLRMAVWTLYYAAQMLITLGVLLAR